MGPIITGVAWGKSLKPAGRQHAYRIPLPLELYISAGTAILQIDFGVEAGWMRSC